MKTPKYEVKVFKRHKWLRRILIALAVIVLVPISLFMIGWFNRDTIIDVFQEWYKQNNSGTLTIGTVNASFLTEFPNVGFTLKDIKQTNTDTIADTYKSIQIDEAKVVVGAGNLLKGNIKFEKIIIKNTIIYSEVVSNRPREYHEKLKRDKQNSKPVGFRLPEWLHKDGVAFSVYNIKYIAKDSILHKNFNLNIHKIKGNYIGKNLKLYGNAALDITVNDLGFNTKKGSFFNGARVTGEAKFKVDLKENTLEFTEFPLRIDQQTFQLKANFDLTESNIYVFELHNPKTDLKAVKGLLPDSLAVKLKNYQIQKPFKTSLKLSGKFTYGDNPDLEAEFSTEANEIIIADKFQLKDASFNGYLTNDLYKTNALDASKKSRKDIKLAFNTIKAQIDDIKIDVSNAYFQSTPEALNFINAKIILEGSNETLVKLIETDNFDFEGGTFQLNATILGDISNPDQFLNNTKGHFKLDNTRAILKKNGLQLPIQTIDLTLDRTISTLNRLTVNLPNGENLVLTGTLNNISGLISKKPSSPTTSQVILNSETLNINELIAMAKQFIPKSESAVSDRKTLHETLDAVYGQFHPQFNINVKSFTYNDVIITDVKSKIELTSPETILLRNFNFSYFDAQTNLKGSVTVNEPNGKLNDAIYINADAASAGSIKVFEKLFNIKLFRIDSGDFAFHGTVAGNIREFNELLNNSKGDLNLTNIKLFYPPAEMDIEIDSLSLFVDNSDLILKKFNLEIDDLYPINLNGNIKDFPTFLLDAQQKSGSIFMKVSAPFIDGDELITTISSLKNDDKPNTPTIKKALHTVFKDVNKFNPKFELSIDSLKYRDLVTQNVRALMYFENDSILKLNNLDLSFKESTVNILGEINSHSQLQNSSSNAAFEFEFSILAEGMAEDLNDYLKTKNFVFKSGAYEFTGNYKGQSDELKIFNSNAFGDLKIGHAVVDFEAAGLQIPVDSLHVEINDDLAELKALDINLPGKSSIYFSGSIDNFSDFINGSNTGSGHSSEFSIYSPYLSTNDIEIFLENTKSNKEKPIGKELNLENFKEAMVKINASFYPTIDIKVDTLMHRDFSATNFDMNLAFKESGEFSIEDTHLDFYGGSIDMDVDVGIQNSNNIPVIIDMRVNALDVNELVTRFDFFNDDDLRKAEKIEGTLNYALKAHGTLGNDGKLNMDSLNGTLEIELDSLELFNYAPAMENSVLMKDERFKNLRFRPITQALEIKNGEIIIPRTEIQSTAIHLFVEGSIKMNEYMNIWLSLPWSNLKSQDGLTLPSKTSYSDAGSKFYVQLLQDETHEKEKHKKLKVKVKLSNRKLRKQKEKQN